MLKQQGNKTCARKKKISTLILVSKPIGIAW